MRRLTGFLGRREMLTGAGALLAAACGARSAGAQVAEARLAEGIRNDAAFPLRIHESGRFLVDAEDRPFLVHGDAAWSLIAQLSREDVIFYLDDRVARGFNTLLISLLERRYATNAPANLAGDPPFLTPGDFSTPNEAYFAHAEWCLREARARGFHVLLCVSYIGFIDAHDGWYQDMVTNSVETLRGYGRYVARRFRELDNITWVNGGDDNPPNREVVRAIALGLREESPLRLQTVHCGYQTAALDYWEGEAWLDLNSLYTDEVPPATWRERTRPQAMPFFMLEATYEEERAGNRWADEALIRAVAYQTLLGGGCGHVFGANPIWNFGGPYITRPTRTWREALNGRGTQSMVHLRNLVATLDWTSLVPDEGEFLIEEANRDHVRPAVAAMSTDRRTALVYAPRASALSIDLTLMAAAPRLRWLDPSDGSSQSIELAASQDRRRVTLTPRRRNAAGFGDWVIVAEV